MGTNLPNEAVFSLITPPPSEQRQAHSTETSGSEELLRIEAHDVIERFGKPGKIATTGNADYDTKYKLGDVTCLATPQIAIGMGGGTFRIVEEICPQDSSNIEPRGFSIRRKIAEKDEEIIAFIGTGRIENALGEKATAEQTKVAINLLSFIKKSLESLLQDTNSSIGKTPIRMKYFPKTSPVIPSREEGRDPLSVS